MNTNITIIPSNYILDNNKTVTSEDHNNNSKIPHILHMIWVGERKEPDYLNNIFDSWKRLMPNWQIILWKNSDINTNHFPEEIVNLLNKVEEGAQKADIMRYFIMEKYGGFYVDTDVTPHRSFEILLKEWNNSSVFLCHDLPLTWNYISIGFFGATPNHPIFKKACELVYSSTINTPDIHLKTGPHLLGQAVAYTNFEKNDVILLPTNYFYHNLEYDDRFGNHFYAASWVK